MSPLNQCNKEKEKLERKFKSLQSKLNDAQELQVKLLHVASKERLKAVMYSSMFKSVLLSVEEDLEHARTIREAKEWVLEIINRFKPAFDVTDVDAEPNADDVVDNMGIEFNRENLRQQYGEIFKELSQSFIQKSD
jgi:hypothetical protein